MHCLIVINSYSKAHGLINKSMRLKEELKKKGIDSDIMKTCEIPVTFVDSKATIEGVDKYDFCLFLDKDKYIGEILSHQMPVFNSPKATEWCDDKTLTYMKTIGLDIKTPITIPAILCYTKPTKEEMDTFINFLLSKLSFPIVCKQSYGSLGKQVYLIKNKDELEKKYLELACVTHLYQEYVGINIERSEDYRIITIGGKYVTAMKRINENDFRSNISSGGHGEKVIELPKGLKEAAELISRKLNLDYAGIDLLVGKNNQIYFLEANSNAFFEEIEKITGENVAEKFVDYCIKKVKKLKRKK